MTGQRVVNRIFQNFLHDCRKERLETQEIFWGRFGVTQSRGCRFEQGTEIPVPVLILIKLYLNGIVTDEDLRAIASDNKKEEQSTFNLDI